MGRFARDDVAFDRRNTSLHGKTPGVRLSAPAPYIAPAAGAPSLVLCCFGLASDEAPGNSVEPDPSWLDSRASYRDFPFCMHGSDRLDERMDLLISDWTPAAAAAFMAVEWPRYDASLGIKWSQNEIVLVGVRATWGPTRLTGPHADLHGRL